MNRERLAVEVAGIRMATPVMGASGTFGFGMEYEDFLDLADVGAVVSKGVTPKRRAHRRDARRHAQFHRFGKSRHRGVLP